MKKMLSVFLIFIMSSIFIVGCSNDPYIGRYRSSDNTILELNSNGNCTIINNFYKDVFYTYAKYSIEDNEIEIVFENNEQNYFRTKSLKGKVKGSNIEFYNYSSVKEEDIYSKMD
ncbi:hypothetical protein [Clostridium chromiireducens]|uniref:Lipoprotein n=1 Tax=Clostridium chromiireducens TaxID=225345 RepID=A0A1V4IJZ7_9CLOT|nr:hypothetical protein [Clostridium chromiireducens]MVX66604.1 hypothetical protein [Clostridium chromiireducens]OPJ60348.1 hypothetical protein CLCHR_29670 [Clostridium chromiireducens]